MIINSKHEETAIEEWIDFPALDSMLAKVDKEDKNTNIQVSYRNKMIFVIKLKIILEGNRCFYEFSKL